VIPRPADNTRDPSIDAPAEEDWVVNEMTFPDNLEHETLFAPRSPARRNAGVNPISERGEDYERDEFMRELEQQPSRPLTGDETRAAAADSGSVRSVYAPASERVPVEPLPGDREIMDHVDTLTAERRAAGAHREAGTPPIANSSAIGPG